MLPERIFLIDQNPKLVTAWEQAFATFPAVTVIEGDFFEQAAHAMVSPANSFGIMDGGLDLAIRNVLGFSVEKAVQARIRAAHHGELPVGSAEIVATRHESWPYLVCAPTMRVPENISRTVNAYLAFRAALLAVARFNQSTDSAPIQSLVCPGLGTGVGRLEPTRCAAQMRIAYESVLRPADIPSFQSIHSTHIRLLSS